MLQNTVKTELPFDMAQTAMSAINTLLNMSMWTLGLLAVVLTMIAVFGWWAIKTEALRLTRKTVGMKLDDHLGSDKFSHLLDVRLDEALEKKASDVVQQLANFKARSTATKDPEFNKPEGGPGR